MTTEAVIAVYDSLSEAEAAELLLEEMHLPVGQMSLYVSSAKEERYEDDVTPRDVARTLADTGIQVTKDQIAEYEQALREDKVLLIFYGDADQVDRAHKALRRSDDEDLRVLSG